MVWFDRIVMVGIAGLVLFTPFAIGSVNPWAFSAAEVVIFLLTIVWIARLMLDKAALEFLALGAPVGAGGPFYRFRSFPAPSHFSGR
jgi:hypothetical protein